MYSIDCNDSFKRLGVYAPCPPKAVLGPTFTSGSGDDEMVEWSGPFTGLLWSDEQDARERA
jgi:hypothetical protein